MASSSSSKGSSSSSRGVSTASKTSVPRSAATNAAIVSAAAGQSAGSSRSPVTKAVTPAQQQVLDSGGKIATTNSISPAPAGSSANAWVTAAQGAYTPTPALTPLGLTKSIIDRPTAPAPAGVKMTPGQTLPTSDASTPAPAGVKMTPTPTYAPDVAAEIARAQDVYANADTLAGKDKYVGQTPEQIRSAAHNYAEKLRNGGAIQPPSTPVIAAPAQQDNQQQIQAIDDKANADMKTELQTILDSTNKTDLSQSATLVDKLTKSLNELTAPTAKSEMQTYLDQRAQLGVGTLEDSLAQKNADLAKFDAEYQAVHATEGNRLVSMATVRRRQSAEDIQYQQDRANMVADINMATNQLNQKYSVIDTIVKLTGADSATAQATYQNAFANTLSVINLLNNKTTQEQNVANAHLTMVQNLIKDKNFNYNTLDPQMKTAISNLEIQAGLPLGFTSHIQAATKDPIISTSKIVQADGSIMYQTLTQNPITGDTKIVNTINSGLKERVVKSGGGGGATATAKAALNEDISAVTSEFDSVATAPDGSFQYIPVGQYEKMKRAWVALGSDHTSKMFDDQFSAYLRPGDRP